MAKKSKTTTIEQPKIVDAPSIKYSKMLRNLIWNLDHDIEYSQASLDKWALRFAEDAADAFSWSSQTFEEAARNRIAKEVKRYIEMGLNHQTSREYDAPTDLAIIEETRRIIFEEVVRGARWPQHSTSQPSNCIAQCLVARRAEWLTKLDSMLSRD